MNYFRCERLRAVINVEVCLKRQENGKGRLNYGWKSLPGAFPACQDCPQGQAVKRGEVVLVPRPQPVVNSNIKKEEPMKEKKFCVNHPDRETLQFKDGRQAKYCRECWGAHNSRAGRRQKQEGPKVVLSFAGREDLLAAIRAQAEAEERTVEQQIVYWLKCHVHKEAKLQGLQA